MDEFEVILLKQPIKYLDKQSDKDAASIRQGLEKLKRLEGDITVFRGAKNTYRMRVRDWRILFEIEGNIITVTTIGPRGDVYK